MLPEQRAWRQFAYLPNRHRVPDVRMLHEFRRRIGVAGLRRVNEVLLTPLLETLPVDRPTITLMDATDLPAADRGFKKNDRPLRSCARRPGWTHTQDRTKSLLCRLQATHVPIVALCPRRAGRAGAPDVLGCACQCGRRRAVGANTAMVRPALELEAGLCRRRHGIAGCGQ